MLERLEQRALLAVDMAFVTIANPGNAADSSTGGIYGSVAEPYRLGTYEVTIAQYTDFLNAVAKVDTYGLYNATMGTNRNVSGILQTTTADGFQYSAIEPSGTNPSAYVSAANRPITFVSWFDAARFANWMANGQPAGGQTAATTENGPYALLGATSGSPPASNATNPNTGLAATYWLPTEDQWYKAAFYSPSLNAGAGGYVSYATASSTAPGNTLGAAANQANYRPGGTTFAVTQSTSQSSSQNYLTDVGAFSGSRSPLGTFDQSGNVWEWTDFVVHDPEASTRTVRGGGWTSNAAQISASGRLATAATQETRDYGFRLASSINAPPTAVTLTDLPP